MSHVVVRPVPRRQFLVSGLTVFGSAMALGSAALLSGCGADDKSAGHVENATDPTKTPDGIDSMKASREKYKTKK